MFYSVDLLTLRRNGKFAKCWLAANLAPTAFRNKFRRHTISAINVIETCEELITYVTTHEFKNKFSLYLSSQLMFGAIRIFVYQTDTIFKQQWELWISTSSAGKSEREDGTGKKRREKIPNLPLDLTLLPPEEPPAVAHTITNVVANIESITLREDNLLAGYDAMMRDADWLNFGALTASQMDHILEHDGLLFADALEPMQVRAAPGIEGDETPHIFKVPNLSIPGEFRDETRDLVRISEPDVIPIPEISVETIATTVLEPQIDVTTGTPVKRKLPYAPDIETPTKKDRVDAKEDETTEPVPIPIPTAAAPEEPSIDMVLEPVNIGDFPLIHDKKKYRKLKVDVLIELSAKALRRRRENIFFETIPKTHVLLRKSAEELLNTPSTRPVWAKPLLINYEMIILEPISQPALDIDVPELPPRVRRTLPRVGPSKDVVRAPDISAAEPSGELSRDAVAQITSEDISKSDRTKTLEQITIDEKPIQVELPPLVERPTEVPDYGKQVAELPEVPDEIHITRNQLSRLPKISRNVIRDWVEDSFLLESVTSAPSEKIIEESEESSISRSVITWVKADILGMLEILWSQKRLVQFRHICPRSSCTRKDVAQVFVFLLELHKSKDIKLMQAKPYNLIYIQKYPSFS